MNAMEITARERIGDYYSLLPIVISFVCFLIIEYFVIRSRNKFQVIDPPSIHKQFSYLNEMYSGIFKHNQVNEWVKTVNNKRRFFRNISFPYAHIILLFICILGFLLGLIFMYEQPLTTTYFLFCVLALTFIYIGVLVFLWHIVITGVVFHRIIKKVKRRCDLENNKDD